MRRLTITAAVALAVLIGCGGGDDSPAPQNTTTTEQTLKQRGDRMAATMRDLANALSLADCERIGPLRDRMLAQSRALARYRDEPGVAAAQAEVGELNSEIEALLQEECQ